MKRKHKILAVLLPLNVLITCVVTIQYSSPSDSSPSRKDYLFAFAHITDSQFSASSAIFEKTTAWLSKQENLSFVLHTGDIVSNIHDEKAWKNAYDYMHQMDGRCRWAVLAGDDDVLERDQIDLTNYKKYFGNGSIDQYFIVEDRLLFLLLSWENRDESISPERLKWMDEVIQNHKELYVVVCLHQPVFGIPFLNLLREELRGPANAEEILRHLDKHRNVIMTLNGHIHLNWIQAHLNGKSKVWSVSTEALMQKGYIRLFYVYEDKIEVYGYAPWTDSRYLGPLDRFTIELEPSTLDVDGER